LALLGKELAPARDGDIITAATLEDAAHAAVALRRRLAWAPTAFTTPYEEIENRARSLRARLGAERGRILGLYAGGTLAHEASLILQPVARAEIVDLGADEHTVGRPHPMLDSSFRVKKIEDAARSADLAVLLLDVVLGYGVAPDPAGDLAEAIARVARSAAVVAWVLPSNAQAARAAAMVATETDWRSLRREPRDTAWSGQASRGTMAPATERGRRMAGFLGSEVRVVNLGLEAFALDLASRGVPV